jgi:hypothetical protein
VIDQGHPYHFLRPVFQRPGLLFQFGKYVYHPDSPTDSREPVDVTGTRVTQQWVEKTIEALQPMQELALHSLVRSAERSWHIPMIDFSYGGPFDKRIVERFRKHVPLGVLENMAFFETGRSYHAYSKVLLRQREWIDFMGSLLLVNPRGEPEIVDARWVGHRLSGGFASLRWSKNTRQYEAAPRFLCDAKSYL